MKIDIDLESGTVKAEFSLRELGEIMAALDAVKDKAPAAPRVFTLAVESGSTPGKYHQTRIWRDNDGLRHGECDCEDHIYRHSWCKHLARADRARLSALS